MATRMTEITYSLWLPPDLRVSVQRDSHDQPETIAIHGGETVGDLQTWLHIGLGREEYTRLMSELAQAGLAAGWVEMVGTAKRPEGA